jgi:hypothetical protein
MNHIRIMEICLKAHSFRFNFQKPVVCPHTSCIINQKEPLTELLRVKSMYVSRLC